MTRRVACEGERATHGHSVAVKDVGIDHGGLDMLVTQEVLYRSDVIPGFEQMCGEAMAERVRRYMLVDAGEVSRAFDGFLERAACDVMTASDASSRIVGDGLGGKDVLPDPSPGGFRVLPLDGGGEVDQPIAAIEVRFVSAFGAYELRP